MISGSLGLTFSAELKKALAQIGPLWSEVDGFFVLLARFALFTELHVNSTQQSSHFGISRPAQLHFFCVQSSSIIVHLHEPVSCYQEIPDGGIGVDLLQLLQVRVGPLHVTGIKVHLSYVGVRLPLIGINLQGFLK